MNAGTVSTRDERALVPLLTPRFSVCFMPQPTNNTYAAEIHASFPLLWLGVLKAIPIVMTTYLLEYLSLVGRSMERAAQTSTPPLLLLVFLLPHSLVWGPVNLQL